MGASLCGSALGRGHEVRLSGWARIQKNRRISDKRRKAHVQGKKKELFFPGSTLLFMNKLLAQGEGERP
ncbi:hypothetical protein HU755_11800 [Pseudomonas sp. SWRI111]|uniref:hypothetical protein n=1 Tax=Pseudomonas sp. SWRI111 TaxID=2745507 RepID=UPI0016491345|nr:hypothetical protein [Pseudomonas sp. SWRI111]MBC3207473.1 hypothetical protein [Pseudomonas sp. SWRI111]